MSYVRWHNYCAEHIVPPYNWLRLDSYSTVIFGGKLGGLVILRPGRILILHLRLHMIGFIGT